MKKLLLTVSRPNDRNDILVIDNFEKLLKSINEMSKAHKVASVVTDTIAIHAITASITNIKDFKVYRDPYTLEKKDWDNLQYRRFAHIDYDLGNTEMEVSGIHLHVVETTFWLVVHYMTGERTFIKHETLPVNSESRF